jgi:hypothetical protein
VCNEAHLALGDYIIVGVFQEPIGSVWMLLSLFIQDIYSESGGEMGVDAKGAEGPSGIQ